MNKESRKKIFFIIAMMLVALALPLVYINGSKYDANKKQSSTKIERVNSESVTNAEDLFKDMKNKIENTKVNLDISKPSMWDMLLYYLKIKDKIGKVKDNIENYDIPKASISASDDESLSRFKNTIKNSSNKQALDDNSFTRFLEEYIFWIISFFFLLLLYLFLIVNKYSKKKDSKIIRERSKSVRNNINNDDKEGLL